MDKTDNNYDILNTYDKRRRVEPPPVICCLMK